MRTSGSKRHYRDKVASVLVDSEVRTSARQMLTNFGIGTLVDENRGGTPIDVRLTLEARPCPVWHGRRRLSLCRRSASDFSFFRSCRPSCPGIAVRRTASRCSPMPGIHAEAALANAPTGILLLQLRMDHPIKTGGDESEHALVVARMLKRIARTARHCERQRSNPA
jgi:hypothetical protein